MATTDNVLSDLIINDLTQEQYDALVASGEVQEGQIYATDGAGSSGGGSATGGLESVAHDSSLEGAGTTASPLKVASTVIAQINDKADGTVVETLSSVVSENTTKLNNKADDDKVVHLAGNENITGVKTFTLPDNIKFTASKTTGYTPGMTNATNGVTPATNVPWSRNGWHDHFAFGQSFTIFSKEVSTDGETWVADDRDISYLFAQKEYGATGEFVIAPNAGEMGFRFVLQSANIAYSNIQWIEIGFAYTTAHTVRLLIESSPDGAEWTEVHNSTTGASATNKYLYVGNLSTGNTYLRISIIKTDAASLDAISRLLYVKGWTTRKGNQGRGIEFEKPYFWDNVPNLMPIKSSGCNLGSTSRRWGTTYTTNVNVGGQMFNADSVKKLNNLPETVDLTDYVKNTDYAAGSKAGIIKVGSTLGTSTSSGYINCLSKTLEAYKSDSTTTIYSFISKGTLENIKDDYIKRGLTANTIELTDEEKTAAQDWLGIKQGASLPILSVMMSDHILDDMSWLRADTFSWQSGDVYVAAYNHIVTDFETPVKRSVQLYCWGSDWFTTSSTPTSGDVVYLRNLVDGTFEQGGVVEYWDGMALISITTTAGISGISQPRNASRDTVGEIPSQYTDTIGDITISYYLAQDGHKICLPDQETNLSSLYESTGVAWYYLLDTTNKQFKLPRTKFGFTGLRDSVGGYVAPGLPNVEGDSGVVTTTGEPTGAFSRDGAKAKTWNTDSSNTYAGTTFDASRSNSIYGASDTVQSPATQMYLYFYVGNFTQEAIEQTAGLNAELFNGKADSDLKNIPTNYDYVVESQLPTAENGYTQYRKYRSGFVEQWGRWTGSQSLGKYGVVTISVTLPIEMADSEYYCETWCHQNNNVKVQGGYENASNTSTVLKVNVKELINVATTITRIDWYVCGMAA